MQRKLKAAIILVFVFLNTPSFAQQEGTEEAWWWDIVKSVMLDSVTITPLDSGLNIPYFVRLVQKDTTLFRAFTKVRNVSYISDNVVDIFDKKGGMAATYRGNSVQQYVDSCRILKNINERTTGKYYDKKGEHNYYTAQLFYYIFQQEDTVCYRQADLRRRKEEFEKLSEKDQERTNQLKTLIFNPGADIGGVPFIKDRMEIFGKRMSAYYDHLISKEVYQDSIPCYVFTTTVKNTLKEKEKSDVIINKLVTWFRQTDNQVMARLYDMSYRTVLFDFDVVMDVRLRPFQDIVIPSFIGYDGYWNVVLKKPEKANWSITFNPLSKTP